MVTFDCNRFILVKFDFELHLTNKNCKFKKWTLRIKKKTTKIDFIQTILISMHSFSSSTHISPIDSHIAIKGAPIIGPKTIKNAGHIACNLQSQV